MGSLAYCRYLYLDILNHEGRTLAAMAAGSDIHEDLVAKWSAVDGVHTGVLLGGADEEAQVSTRDH